MTLSRFKYLKSEDIKKLDSYEFAPRLIAEGYLAGRHVSHAKGLSTEFRDYRQYLPGDDISMLDWKVYARTDRHYIKTFDQETNTVCYIFLDSSASMGFGRQITKLEFSSFFAAALCYLMAKGNNNVSLQLFDDKIREFVPPGNSSRHMQLMMNRLERNEPGGKTHLAEAIRRSFPLLKLRGTIIIVSDFLDNPGRIFAALSQYLHAGYRICLFHIIDPDEVELKPQGLTRFIDPEDASRITVHTESVKHHYQAEFQKHIDTLRELSVRREIDYTVARTDSNYFNLFDRLVK